MKASCLTLVALTVLPTAQESPSLMLKAGDVTSSAWTVETRVEVAHSVLTFSGNDEDLGSGSTSTATLLLEVSDEHAKVGEDGSPRLFVRTYGEVNTTLVRDDSEADDRDDQSELSGAAVTFTYDEGSEEWSKDLGEESRLEDDVLEGLAVRMDLCGVLPAGDMEVGDTWGVESSFLASVLRPGGAVVIREELEDFEVDADVIQITIPGSSDIDRIDEFEGELIATFEEVLEEDDARFARIVVEVDVTSELDIVDQLAAIAESFDVDQRYSEASLERSFEGSITVLWNLGAKRPQSLEAELEGDTALAAEWTIAKDDIEIDMAVLRETDVAFSVQASFGD